MFFVIQLVWVYFDVPLSISWTIDSAFYIRWFKNNIVLALPEYVSQLQTLLVIIELKNTEN